MSTTFGIKCQWGNALPGFAIEGMKIHRASDDWLFAEDDLGNKFYVCEQDGHFLLRPKRTATEKDVMGSGHKLKLGQSFIDTREDQIVKLWQAEKYLWRRIQ